MNITTHLRRARVALGLLLLVGALQQPLHADISVRLSVKFILNFNGTRPPGIGTNNTFQVEVDRANGILAATGRGVRLQVVDYIDIQPAAPSGQPADYWFNLPARNNRLTMENAALANPATWRWNNGAINIFVNNTISGQCSFVNGGSSISLGQSIGTGTVLHEVGHFFNLPHTHSNDPDCSTFTPTQPLNTYLADGDSMASTIRDHACFTRDQLSMANFGMNYASLQADQQAAVNSSWLNVMSYHQEDQLNDDQMDIWSDNANGSRLFACSARTWFVSNAGFDIWTGDSPFAPFATVQRALSAVGTADDIIMLRSGNYTGPKLINTPCTVRAMRGPVSITSP